MSNYLLTCLYCNHQWITNLPSRKMRCIICNDKNITILDLSKNRIDYYAGSPPFEEKKKEVVFQETEEFIGEHDVFNTDYDLGYMPGHWD